ncbi:DUF6332 family protein [Streptomyces sp. SID3343]|uniref:DUF6332 family protein n=1 Tax=Streptomyces sp. SID3343 TaxID=2690260 RepID=UPI00136F23B7|nr:DUF6332 family protein [Streptomyces sp. SID3343]MYW01877.1 hypothetical protein [Streptomyces sp. SID3343]
MWTGPRSSAERDVVTVEIAYALASAGFLAVVVFAVIAGPAWVWDLPSAVDESLFVAGRWTAGVLAVIRVVHVLRQHARPQRARPSSD